MVLELRTQYGSLNPLDYEMEKSIFALVSAREKNQTDLQELFRLPEISSFIEMAKETSPALFKIEELQKDMDKVEPEELPDSLKDACCYLKEDIKNIDFSDPGISVPDIIMNFLDSAVKYVDSNK